VGLTTAATIWLTAALGMALGGGNYALAGVGLVVTLGILWFLPQVEHWVDNMRKERTYEIVCGLSLEKTASLAKVFTANGVRVKERHQVKAGDKITCRWVTSGAPKAHERLVNQLFADPEVQELRF
jgi:putative Mg2+ transporter-C (MgtC) family protein